jgi:hypothetical protein
MMDASGTFSSSASPLAAPLTRRTASMAEIVRLFGHTTILRSLKASARAQTGQFLDRVAGIVRLLRTRFLMPLNESDLRRD